MAGSENDNNVTQVYLLGKTYLANNQGQFYIRNDPIIFMAAGDRHTIIITESGRAFAFGDNSHGQLGLGHTNPVEKVSCIKSLKFDNGNEKLQMAACGRDASLVATNTGALYAFGSNSNSQLGFESPAVQSQPTKIKQLEGHKWKQIAMGAEHACALTLDGRVFVWGSNEDGQCGLPQRINVVSLPRELSMKKTINAISCGYYHTAFIDENGALYVCGNNTGHQLGQMKSSATDNDPMSISLPDKVKAVSCGNQHSVVLLENGQVYACGDGSRGQLGLGEKIQSAEHFELIEKIPRRVISIAAGEGHTAIIGARGDLLISGDGKHGKLGSTTFSNEFDACLVERFKGYQVLQVACGGCQTIILARKRLDDEKKSSGSDEDISNATLSVTQRPKSRARVVRNKSITERSHNVTESMDATMRSVKPIDSSTHLRVEPDRDSNNEESDNELSASMKSATFNQTHTLTNGKLRPTQTLSLSRTHQPRAGGEELKPLRTGVLDRTARLNPETQLSPRNRSRSPVPERTTDEDRQKNKLKEDDSDSEEEFRKNQRKTTTVIPPEPLSRAHQNPTRAVRQQEPKKDDSDSDDFREPLVKQKPANPPASSPRLEENPTRGKQQQQSDSSESETSKQPLKRDTLKVPTSARDKKTKAREENDSDDGKPNHLPVLRRLEPARSSKNQRVPSPSPSRRDQTIEEPTSKRPLPNVPTRKQRKQSSDSTPSSDDDTSQESEDDAKGKKSAGTKTKSKDPPKAAGQGSTPTGKGKNNRDEKQPAGGAKTSESSRDKNNKNEDKSASKSDSASAPGFFARIFGSKTPATPKPTETNTPTNTTDSSSSRACVVM